MDTAQRLDLPSASNSASPHGPIATRWIALLDDTVDEVFEAMLRRRCTIVEEAPPSAAYISAKILFSGTPDGHCVVQASLATASRLTGALLGAEDDWGDKMIDDAVGEMCNMIAGGWKSRLETFMACFQLSVPKLSRGPARHALGHARLATRRLYAFDDSVLEVTLSLN